MFTMQVGLGQALLIFLSVGRSFEIDGLGELSPLVAGYGLKVTHTEPVNQVFLQPWDERSS
jgi:hypothetical protein